jgi:hypothetical protein
VAVLGVPLTPTEWWADVNKSGLVRDGLAYGAGALLVLVGLAMVAFGPAVAAVKTAVKAVA